MKRLVLPLCGLLAALPALAADRAEPSDSAAFRFLEAKVLLGEGRYAEALEGLEAAVDRAPEDPYLRLELGTLAARIGRVDQAARQADEAVRLAPRDPDVLYGVGEIYQGLANLEPGFAERARTAFRGMLEADPDDPRALLALGRLTQQQGDLQGAEEYYRRLASRRPGQRTSTFLLQVLMQQGDSEGAMAVLREALAAEPGALEMRFTLADLLSEAGRPQEALEVLSAVPEAQRNEPELVRREAAVLLQLGRPGDARVRLEGAVAGNPEAVRLHLFLALLLADEGEPERAREILAAQLASHPLEVDVAQSLVRLLIRVGDPDEAVRVTTRSVERIQPVDPESAGELIQGTMEALAGAGLWERIPPLGELVPDGLPEARRSRILQLEVEALRRGGRLEEALDRLDASSLDGPGVRALRAEILLRRDQPRRAEAILEDLATEEPRLAAQVYQSVGRYEDALPLWESTVARDPVAPDARFSLAAAYERTGRLDDAETVFRKLIGDYPDFHLALNYLGYMWAEQGENLQEAQELVERALDLDPDNGAYADSLGWVHFQRGELDQALVQLDRAASLLPEDGTVQEHLGDVHRALGNAQAANRAYRRALELDEDGRAEEIRRKLQETERALRGSRP